MQRIIDFLYPDKKKYLPQLVLGKKKSGNKLWFPGNSTRTDQVNIDNFPLVGFTGKAFTDRCRSQKEQEFKLFWIGLDIDDCKEFEKISKICANGSVRVSTSGTGCHVIYRLQTPLLLDNSIDLTGLIKANLQSDIKKLEENNISVCSVNGSKCFYLLGGKQKWIKKRTKKIKIDLSLTVEKSFNAYQSKEKIEWESLNRLGQRFFNDLFDNGVLSRFDQVPRKFNVYIKQLFEIFKDSLFAFQTKSPMSSFTPHVNGFVFIQGYNLNLFSHSDDKIILSFECMR